MLRILLIGLLIISMLSGCRGKIFSSKSIFAPIPARMGGPDRAHADPEYLQGWDEGCETGLSTMVPGYYKSFYSYKIDPKMMANEVYYKAWKDSYTYCRHYAFRYAWQPFDHIENSPKNLCVLCPDANRGQ